MTQRVQPARTGRKPRTARRNPPMPRSKRSRSSSPHVRYVLRCLPLAGPVPRAAKIAEEGLAAGVPPEVVAAAMVARSLVVA